MSRKILFVEDDPFHVIPYTDNLMDAGFEVVVAESTSQALEALSSKRFDLILLDVMLPAGDSFSSVETSGGFKTGLALARMIRRNYPSLPIAALTLSEDQEVKEWFERDSTVVYLEKARTNPRQLPRLIKRFLKDKDSPLRVFIVHGRDIETLAHLKIFLKETLKVPEVIVLNEQASLGRTVIEKFEFFAAEIDLVFVLITPDDVGGFSDSKELNPRARQNVIFELGYFLGSLRRHSGRLFLLHKGRCEIPSDLYGIVFIDITNGIKFSEEEIRNQLRSWL